MYRVHCFEVLIACWLLLFDPNTLVAGQAAGVLEGEDPSVLRARMEVDRMRILAENGTVDRSRLLKAEADLLDKQDEAVITRALYGKDITSDEADQTIDAARRRLDRRKRRMESDEVGASQKESSDRRQDMERAEKDLDWAIARAKLVRRVESMAEEENVKGPAREQRSNEEAARQRKLFAKRAAEARSSMARTRFSCGIVYSQTATKKVVDLTVEETRLIKICEKMNFYAPNPK